jgi:hypothetical protein
MGLPPCFRTRRSDGGCGARVPLASKGTQARKRDQFAWAAAITWRSLDGDDWKRLLVEMLSNCRSSSQHPSDERESQTTDRQSDSNRLLIAALLLAPMHRPS